MTQARRRELDLVEVNPAANPPVCKIINYGKYLYDLAKREKDTRKNTAATKLKELKDKDVRVVLDDSREKLGAKIRLAELAKVPYILTIGERESSSELVSVRSRKITASEAKPWPDFFHQLLDEIAHRSL